ncbi:MAG: ATP-binding cassette domain-containing protein [Cytophagales bacterium]|nr:ATP-binding cassette domain-containing protein [Cytophaga sp.]
MFEIDIHKTLHSAEGDITLSITLSIRQGEFISLYGKSGAGKTMLLKILAGLVVPETGTIKTAGGYWLNTQSRMNVLPQKRNIGYVFQDYALFPNMSVRENLSFVQKDQQQVDELLEITELVALQDKLPNTLSGGQQQRVALARAVARKPKLLLLDEPLSALDADMRYKLQEQLRFIHTRYGLTTILVTHDTAEMYALSDRVVEIESGTIKRSGTPAEVFQHREITGKIQLIGKIIDIRQSDALYIAKVIAGNSILNIVITNKEAALLHTGDQVQIVSKAFNPLLIKIEPITP